MLYFLKLPGFFGQYCVRDLLFQNGSSLSGSGGGQFHSCFTFSEIPYPLLMSVLHAKSIICAAGLKYKTNLQYTQTLIKQPKEFWHPCLGTIGMENRLGGQLLCPCSVLPLAPYHGQMEQICNWLILEI